MDKSEVKSKAEADKILQEVEPVGVLPRLSIPDPYTILDSDQQNLADILRS